MSETPKTASERRSPAWMRILLVLSLALNLAVVGLVVGTVLREDGPARRGPSATSDLGLGPVGRALNKEERRQLKRGAVARRADLRENRQEIRQRLDETLSALATDPLDEAAVAAGFAAQRDAISARQALTHQLFLDMVKDMDLEARQDLAQRLHEGLKRRGKKRDKDRKKD